MKPFNATIDGEQVTAIVDPKTRVVSWIDSHKLHNTLRFDDYMVVGNDWHFFRWKNKPFTITAV